MKLMKHSKLVLLSSLSLSFFLLFLNFCVPPTMYSNHRPPSTLIYTWPKRIDLEIECLPCGHCDKSFFRRSAFEVKFPIFHFQTYSLRVSRDTIVHAQGCDTTTIPSEMALGPGLPT
ncbi:hypothetical protein BU16DRAFT_354606 [Lophium mytilinum]|uniref:Uncharacterized protein n=1 Tax=Lophium mytilinum TaxID=390894 RepID=A0A6A6QXR7_9PEZI|nr:hypothetical protein BU16DRAFT_354606 [Lophium mytilinum]